MHRASEPPRLELQPRTWGTACAALLLLTACGADEGGDGVAPSASEGGETVAAGNGSSAGVGTVGNASATSGGSSLPGSDGGPSSTATGAGTSGSGGGSAASSGVDGEASSGVDGGAGAVGAAGAPSQPVDLPAGVLTAGIWDDNQNFSWFANYFEVQGGDQLPGWFSSSDHETVKGRFDQAGIGYNQLDIALVIDTTGSMGDELAYLQAEFHAISATIHSRYQNSEQRWSLVVYRDQGDEYVTRSFDFTTNLDDFRSQLAAQSHDGGGDFPEAPDQALADMTQLQWRDQADTAKLAFWVADAPHHQTEENVDILTQAILDAQEKAIRINPIASSGIDEFTEFTMRSTAQLTGGQYLFLTDDSGIGGAHKDPTVPCYYVTTLSHALLRVVDAAMNGEPIPVDQNSVVRTAGDPDSSGRCEIGETEATAF